MSQTGKFMNNRNFFLWLWSLRSLHPEIEEGMRGANTVSARGGGTRVLPSSSVIKAAQVVPV
jgi:hypothetical protein